MSQLIRTVTLEAADVARNFIGNVTKREALAFKAGGWASLPAEYAIEKYIYPYATQNFSEKAFYEKISQFGGYKNIQGIKQKQSLKKKSTSGEMVSKKRYSNSSYALNKRLRRVEARSKSEMKMATWSSIGTVTQGTQNLLEITGIAQGSGLDQRIGDKIKIWRVEIRGQGSNMLDHYLIQKHGSTNPVYADFGTANHAFIDGDSSSEFTEWMSIKALGVNSNTTVPVWAVQKFPMGLVVNYAGTGTAAVDNGLLFVSRNTTTTDYTQTLSIRMWYTDK